MLAVRASQSNVRAIKVCRNVHKPRWVELLRLVMPTFYRASLSVSDRCTLLVKWLMSQSYLHVVGEVVNVTIVSARCW